MFDVDYHLEILIIGRRRGFGFCGGFGAAAAATAVVAAEGRRDGGDDGIISDSPFGGI